MGITVDPLEFIIDWLAEKWDAGTVGFTPTFSTTPYKKGIALPLISIREYPTRPEHLNIGSTYHMYYGIFAINFFDMDKGDIWKMRKEIRRIVFAFQKNPTTSTYPSPGIEHILIYEEFPQDDYSIVPPVLGRSIRVILIHLETNS